MRISSESELRLCDCKIVLLKPNEILEEKLIDSFGKRGPVNFFV